MNVLTTHARLSRLFALSVALLMLSTPLTWAGKYNAVISIGDSMPAFTDLPNIDGNAMSSSDLDADIVVLISLANHCPWVKGMDKDMVSLARDFADQSVAFVGLSFNHREDDRLEAMKVHARENGYGFDYLFDESQALGKALGAVRTPEYFVFNKERELVYTGLLYNSPAKINRDGSVNYTKGEPTEFYVADAINASLAGNLPDVTETKAHGCSVKYTQE
ncbi:MAG: thioredoxin family protein [Pseudomonadota bacterium]